jgi:hypothetical protein
MNRASIVLAQQQLLLEMEHALTPVFKKGLQATHAYIFMLNTKSPLKKP